MYDLQVNTPQVYTLFGLLTIKDPAPGRSCRNPISGSRVFYHHTHKMEARKKISLGESIARSLFIGGKRDRDEIEEQCLPSEAENVARNREEYDSIVNAGECRRVGDEPDPDNYAPVNFCCPKSCSLCLASFAEDAGLGPQVVTQCGHSFHRDCWINYSNYKNASGNPRAMLECPLCRQNTRIRGEDIPLFPAPPRPFGPGPVTEGSDLVMALQNAITRKADYDDYDGEYDWVDFDGDIYEAIDQNDVCELDANGRSALHILLGTNYFGLSYHSRIRNNRYLILKYYLFELRHQGCRWLMGHKDNDGRNAYHYLANTMPVFTDGYGDGYEGPRGMSPFSMAIFAGDPETIKDDLTTLEQSPTSPVVRDAINCILHPETTDNILGKFKYIDHEDVFDFLYFIGLANPGIYDESQILSKVFTNYNLLENDTGYIKDKMMRILDLSDDINLYRQREDSGLQRTFLDMAIEDGADIDVLEYLLEGNEERGRPKAKINTKSPSDGQTVFYRFDAYATREAGEERDFESAGDKLSLLLQHSLKSSLFLEDDTKETAYEHLLSQENEDTNPEFKFSILYPLLQEMFVFCGLQTPTEPNIVAAVAEYLLLSHENSGMADSMRSFAEDRTRHLKIMMRISDKNPAALREIYTYAGTLARAAGKEDVKFPYEDNNMTIRDLVEKIFRNYIVKSVEELERPHELLAVLEMLSMLDIELDKMHTDIAIENALKIGRNTEYIRVLVNLAKAEDLRFDAGEIYRLMSLTRHLPTQELLESLTGETVSSSRNSVPMIMGLVY